MKKTLLKTIPIKNGVFQISNKVQQELNKLKNIANLPYPFIAPSLHSNLVYKQRKYTGRCLVAMNRISKNNNLMDNNGSLISKPINYSTQLKDGVHMIGPGGFDHTCENPNTIINPKTHELIAARNIKPGEYLAFNYLTTEWDMKNPFYCKCGSKRCYHYIKGFKYLSKKQKQELITKLPVTKYLKSKVI